MTVFRWITCLLLVSAISSEAMSATPSFSHDIRPILSAHCFACHGPDEEERMADLRLDSPDDVAAMVVSGDADSSEMFARITSDDEDVLMPPADFGKPLTADQIEAIRQWIAAGAAYQEHWAFVAPTKQTPASVPIDSPTDAINHFVQQAIEEMGLVANPAADDRSLLRRVCLDLTGLPPNREQVDTFLSDASHDAYERLVDSLLASRHYGQHMGRYWLDLVRYGDTHGLHLDNYREMWPYRDWVIDAMNANMPIDQFFTEQLAGDLFPDASEAQRIASGFNRLNVTTNEGGSIYDEVFARNVIDRTDAFGTIFLGMTTGCSVCHDHKFDPLTMRDYYSLSAYFNSLDGKAMDANIKDHPPSMPVPTQQQLDEIAECEKELVALRTEMAGPIETVDASQRDWERSLSDQTAENSVVLHPTSVVSEAGVEMKTHEDGTVEVVGEAAAKDTTTLIAQLPANSAWKTLHLEALVEEPNDRVGLSSNGNVVLSEIVVEWNESDAEEGWMEVPVVHAVADVEQSDGSFAVKYAIDGKVKAQEGWAVHGHGPSGPRNAWFVLAPLLTESPDARLRIRLKYQSVYAKHQFRKIRLSLATTMPSVPESQRIVLGSMHSVGPFPVANTDLAYDQSFASEQSKFDPSESFRFEDQDYGWQHREDLPTVAVHRLGTVSDRASVMVLHQPLTAPSDQNVTLLIDTSDGHVVYLNDKEVARRQGPKTIRPLSEEYELNLKKGENRLYVKVVNHAEPSMFCFAFRSPAIDTGPQLAQLAGIPPSDRSDAETISLRKYFRSVVCTHPDWLLLGKLESGLLKRIEQIRSSIATTLIWKELKKPRQAHLLLRGQYDSPGEAVERRTPGFLPPMDDALPNNRLGLAKWLTSDSHPLTSRVAANRVWQQFFGIGLVKTSEDFGSQGQPPSHPELLDWLAVDFRENGWDLKRLTKAIVMSAPYRRSARIHPRAQELDPENRFLARGPRFRLDAEMLRDQALAISGLLVDDIGGPSVKPPQPSGLWQAVGYTRSDTATFSADSGDKVYRRSVYIFWKRTSPPPQMTTFDAPSRESCAARRERTNTPLQALLLMNETQYLEAARALAGRVFEQEHLKTPQDQVAWVFETVTVRPPQSKELEELVGLLHDLTVHYTQHPEQAAKLTGDSSADSAAWTLLCSTLLNLDEVVNK
ncbi:PSD1 and planctomycete cytochrome C domain-containing protein [Novipirellula artificiosorum]|uniref:Planctomycete cytochrome C n=1 Tax=Novipirellula artificiosorum TaxID=2528016 RepID=A0A5C6DH21_9BACT|nr:PSD1 and planctomycete cytochrome C domain-containing protein [Novipirellula artificiosorum]TWU36150.1 Planctomycete cytochrome C [Novipirellula artificiosorum]